MRLQLLLESSITKLEKDHYSNVVEFVFFSFTYQSVLLQTHTSEMQEFCFSLLFFCLSVFCILNKFFLPYDLSLHIVRTANHFFTGHFKTILQLCQKKMHISGYLLPISCPGQTTISQESH